MQVLLHRRRPMDIRVKQPPELLPIPALDRVEHIADRWNLLCHSSPSLCLPSGAADNQGLHEPRRKGHQIAPHTQQGKWRSLYRGEAVPVAVAAGREKAPGPFEAILDARDSRFLGTDVLEKQEAASPA